VIRGQPPLQQIADLLKFLMLQLNFINRNLDILELRYEAAPVADSPCSGYYVKAKNISSLSNASAKIKLTLLIIGTARKLDILLKK